MDVASFQAQLDDLGARAAAAIAAAASPEGLEAVETAILGRKGELRVLLAGIGALPAQDRPRVGALANPVREAVEEALVARRTSLEAEALERRLLSEAEDISLAGRPRWRGSLHPLRETEREIEPDLRPVRLRGSGEPRGRERRAQLPGSQHPG